MPGDYGTGAVLGMYAIWFVLAYVMAYVLFKKNS
jgi:hypothetical protein